MNGLSPVTVEKYQASIQRKLIRAYTGGSVLTENTEEIAQKLTQRHSDEAEITSVYAATSEDVDKAVIAARAAFQAPSWRDMPGTERGDLLYKLATLIEQHKEILATIETWDNGTF
jgi:acyl-CoA reductase-like NAD-dependent aldehyde dehydrogenase